MGFLFLCIANVPFSSLSRGAHLCGAMDGPGNFYEMVFKEKGGDFLYNICDCRMVFRHNFRQLNSRIFSIYKSDLVMRSGVRLCLMVSAIVIGISPT